MTKVLGACTHTQWSLWSFTTICAISATCRLMNPSSAATAVASSSAANVQNWERGGEGGEGDAVDGRPLRFCAISGDDEEGSAVAAAFGGEVGVAPTQLALNMVLNMTTFNFQPVSNAET